MTQHERDEAKREHEETRKLVREALACPTKRRSLGDAVRKGVARVTQTLSGGAAPA